MRERINNIISMLKMMWLLDRRLVVIICAKAIINGITPFISIFLSAYVLDSLSAKEDILTIIITASLSCFAVFLLKAADAQLHKLERVRTEVCVREYNMKKIDRTLTVDYEILESPIINELQARIDNDNHWGAGFWSIIGGFQALLSSVFGLLTAIIILIPLFFTGGLFTDPLSIILMLAFAGIIVLSNMMTTKLGKDETELQNKSARKKSYRSFLVNNQNYKCGKDVRLFRAIPLIKDYMRKSNQFEFVYPMVRNASARGFTENLFSGLLMIISYLFVALRAIAGTLSIGSVLKYASTIYQFVNCLNSTLSTFILYSEFCKRQQSTVEYMNIPDVLYKGTLPIEKRAFCDDGDFEYEIEFRNVSFKYPGAENYVLKNVSMKLRVGERMAVVGMNGSGKTTFIKLLCRLYDPTEGEILLNGINIKKYDYNEYMMLFSVVFQDFKLFSFSLAQNVASDIEYDRERVKACLCKSGFGERLDSMENGIDTCIYKDFDENGVEISGGEAQKIALARALYKFAPFIVLDEPTAALDPIAEAEVYSKFNDIVGERTAIYISHRLSSCRFCDDILVFHKGSIVQRGSHDVLVSDEHGKYHELWYAQSQYYTKGDA